MKWDASADKDFGGAVLQTSEMHILSRSSFPAPNRNHIETKSKPGLKPADAET